MSKKYDSAPNIEVDLRNKFPSIRDQGSRPLCLVFATSDLNTFTHNEKKEFSVEYLSHYSYQEAGETDYTQGLTCQAVSQALEKYGQPHEDVAPYNKNAIKPSIPSTSCNNLFYAKGKEKSDLVKEFITSLDNGHASIIIINLCTRFFNPMASSVIDDENGSAGIHALVVVGYGRYPDNEVCFLIRNSWGNAWANNGHAWLTEKFIKNRVLNTLRLSKI